MAYIALINMMDTLIQQLFNLEILSLNIWF
jgi:hypothetical protein